MQEVLTRTPVVRTNVQTSRFSGADWATENHNIIIGGAGSIGSWTALLLSKTNHSSNIEVWDDDSIEEVNLAGQFYPIDDIGTQKVVSLHNSIYNYSGKGINIMSARITDNQPYGNFDVFVSAFDNMSARKIFFEKFKNTQLRKSPFERNRSIFIDGRLNAEQFQVFFVTPDKYDLYQAHLFDDSEVEDLPCSYKYTTHTACMIASVIVNGYTNWASNIKYNMPDYRELPFKVTYDLSLMLFEKCTQ